MTEKCPVLILGNKIDISSAASEEQIKEYFNLYSHTTGKKNNKYTEESKMRPVEIFMCSILKKQGYGEGKNRYFKFIKLIKFKISFIHYGIKQYILFNESDMIIKDLCHECHTVKCTCD